MDELNDEGRDFTLPSGLRADELLPVVHARGAAMRRRHQILKTAPIVLAVLLLAVPAVSALRDDNAGRNLRLVPPLESTTTTTEADEADEAAADTTTTTETTVAPTTTTTKPKPTTTTTVCRNSHNPGCGPFRWDPAPAPADPAWITIEVSPANPKIGEEVTFTVVHHNPNTVIRVCDSSFSFGDVSQDCTDTGIVCDQRFGPWDPPAKHPDYSSRVFKHTYDQAGAYTVRGSFRTGGRCYDPWADRVQAETTVTVS